MRRFHRSSDPLQNVYPCRFFFRSFYDLFDLFYEPDFVHEQFTIQRLYDFTSKKHAQLDCYSTMI
jgi:hypothetical protein